MAPGRLPSITARSSEPSRRTWLRCRGLGDMAKSVRGRQRLPGKRNTTNLSGAASKLADSRTSDDCLCSDNSRLAVDPNEMADHGDAALSSHWWRRIVEWPELSATLRGR